MADGAGKAVSGQRAAVANGGPPLRRRPAVGAVMVVPGLSKSQRERLEIAAGLASGSMEHRRQAQAIVRRVEAELAELREARAVADDLDRAAERIAAEDGEVLASDAVEATFVTDRFGAVMRHQGDAVVKLSTVRRVSRVDGLKSAWQCGSLSDRAYAAGQWFRERLEATRPPVVTGSLEPGSCGSVEREASMAAAMSRGFAARELGLLCASMDVETARVLMAVAGEGRSLRAVSSGGREWAVCRERLVNGLALVEAWRKKTSGAPLLRGNG